MTALDSYLLLRAIVDEFARCGMEHACTSPGSRNTPIVLTLAAESRLQTWSHVDERCSGFFAIGAARASGRPVAVTCTSGTAAANLLPAVIEAHEGGIPLILLTADRPPELRDVGAGQTIDQLKLYGDAVKLFVELGVPEATPERLRWVRSLACRSYWTALDGRPGAVHLNIPLREPLVLDHPLPDDEPGGGGRADGAPWISVSPTRTAAPATPRRHSFERTVFVAGDLGSDPAAGEQLAAFAARARVPLLADPLSGARRGPAAISHFDLLLRDPDTARELAPDVLCRIGDLPTSKPLRQWIGSLEQAHHVLFAPDERWSDPASRVVQRTVGPLTDLLERISADEVQADASDWLGRWRAADDAVAGAIGPVLDRSGLSEPVVAALLAGELPAEAILFVAASMPIRDAEEFFAARQRPPRVLANRGANGIDGTISAAFGVAAAGKAETVLLIGDVALAHDIGGLLAARRSGVKLTLVVVNNSGGGIFDFLPVAQRAEPHAFELHVSTPTGLSLELVAGLFGLEYVSPSDPAAFRAAIERALTGSNSTLIEVRTERTANRALHAEVERAAMGALAALRAAPVGTGAP